MSFTESDYVMPLEAAGLTFRNNFVVGAGPTVKTIEMIRQIERSGWGGALRPRARCRCGHGRTGR